MTLWHLYILLIIWLWTARMSTWGILYQWWSGVLQLFNVVFLAIRRIQSVFILRLSLTYKSHHLMPVMAFPYSAVGSEVKSPPGSAWNTHQVTGLSVSLNRSVDWPAKWPQVLYTWHYGGSILNVNGDTIANCEMYTGNVLMNRLPAGIVTCMFDLT